jgi:hypothetical protein
VTLYVDDKKVGEGSVPMTQAGRKKGADERRTDAQTIDGRVG